MDLIEKTTLWKRSLASQEKTDVVADITEQARQRLRATFVSFRNRVAPLVAEIHRDLPNLTVHDVTHLDSLWEMADLIAGPNFPITPAEAFVLGGAILLHDAGMALASYPEGIKALQRESPWSDIVTQMYRNEFHRDPSPAELDTPLEHIKLHATATVLRILHAKHAEQLAFISWTASKDDPPQYLIEDIEIRQVFGRVIGFLAHSHWWPIAQVEKEFSRTLGAPHWCPNDWIIDPLKLACLLRVADISHIDARRAPTLLRALRKPVGVSGDHWKFQEKLQKPYLAEDALVYTSGAAFPLKDASAWWLCLDTLSNIDKELRQVDALLADKHLRRFAARRVAGVESPDRLVPYIPTDGWIPVNASLLVSDVPTLIKSLGGEELYGSDRTVSLRELIQNAADAIKARRYVENRPKDWGEIAVRLGKDGDRDWLEVEDNGIGMSAEVLTSYLLDFGKTYWGSDLMFQEFSGLLASGFKATGKYGIGFFSVFMLGASVRIRTRRAEVAQGDTLVLEFNTGLTSRPILRPAAKHERIREGGTCIRVWLEKPSVSDKGLLHRYGDKPPYTLDELCLEISPSLDVDIQPEIDNKKTQVLKSSNWTTAEGTSLFERLHDEWTDTDWKSKRATEFVSKASRNLRLLINENDEIVGRACVTSTRHDKEEPRFKGVVTVGGLSACTLQGVTGLLSGTPEKASRDAAHPIVSPSVLRDWATAQSALVTALYEDPEDLASCAQVIRKCGGNTGNLPVCQFGGVWRSIHDVEQLKNLPSEIILLDPWYVDRYEKLQGFQLAKNVILIEHSVDTPILSTRSYRYNGEWPTASNLVPDFWPDNMQFFHSSLAGAVVGAIAVAWNVPVKDILKSSFLNHDRTVETIVGSLKGEMIREDAIVLRKP